MCYETLRTEPRERRVKARIHHERKLIAWGHGRASDFESSYDELVYSSGGDAAHHQ